MSLTIDATITLPDIVRAAVHRRLQVLQATAVSAETASKDADRAAMTYGDDLSEYLSGIAIVSEVPASIKPLMDALYGVDVQTYVTWSWDTVARGEIPAIIAVHMQRTGRDDRGTALGLQRDAEIRVTLGPVSDETARRFREHHALVVEAERLVLIASDARKATERKDLAREMEGEMLASMIEAQAPDIHDRIEALATGGRLIGVAK
jgi:hypothetical protein